MVRWLYLVLCSSCLVGIGDAQAVSLRTQSSEPLSNPPAAMAAQDMNWDLAHDLAVVNRTANSITVITNHVVARKVEYAVGSTPSAVALADFSGDGYVDIAVANQGSNNISILNNKAVASVEFNTATSYAAGNGPVAIVAGLFNNDAFNDVVVVNQADNAISVLFNSGAGAFPSVVSYGVGSSPSAIAAADFDGNGTLDLAVANQGGNSVSLLLNNGVGVFSAAMSYSAGSSPSALALLDVDRNGTTDIAVTNASAATLSWLSNNGNGTFIYMGYYSVGTMPTALVAADLNGDGYADLAVANGGASTVSVLENNRNGAFAAATTAAVEAAPAAIVAADMDFDGDDDLVTANSGSSTLSLLMNDTDFQPDPFPFTARSDVSPNAVVESNVVILSGMSGWSELTVSGGEYALSRDGGVGWSAWSTTPVLVTVGDQIKLRVTAAAVGHVAVEAHVSVGNVHEAFTVTTMGDGVPDQFLFTDQSGVAPDALVVSQPVTVTGIDVGAPISVASGMYSVNGRDFTSVPGVVNNSDAVRLRVTSSPLSGGTASVTLTIGGVADTFTVTTTTTGATGEVRAAGGGALDPLLLMPAILVLALRLRDRSGRGAIRTHQCTLPGTASPKGAMEATKCSPSMLNMS